jgi:hypothetical protein
MRAALSGSLDVVADRLPAPLVSAVALGEVRAVAARLPAQLSNWVYLERPSGWRGTGASADAPVDLIVNVDARGGDVLAQHNPAAAIDRELRSHPVWTQVEEFARTWRTAGSALCADVSELWLEFDVRTRGSSGRAPIPSMFVDFAADVYRGSPSRRTAAAMNALRALGGAGLAAETASAVRECVLRLPTTALLLYMGSMLARPGHGVRLCIMGLDTPELTRYLASVGWSGARDELERLTREIGRLDGGAHDRPAVVHLDVGSAVRPQLGLEYPFERQRQAQGAIADQELLGFLTAHGLATPGEAAALATWPGTTVATMPHELWPSVVVRRVNHVKLVIDAHGSLAAKLYLCFGHEYACRRVKR